MYMFVREKTRGFERVVLGAVGVCMSARSAVRHRAPLSVRMVRTEAGVLVYTPGSETPEPQGRCLPNDTTWFAHNQASAAPNTPTAPSQAPCQVHLLHTGHEFVRIQLQANPMAWL